MPSFTERLKQGIVVADGAMGTMVYTKGVYINRCFEALNLQQPGLIREVHHAYLTAGAEILEANTYGANRPKASKTTSNASTKKASTSPAKSPPTEPASPAPSAPWEKRSIPSAPSRSTKPATPFASRPRPWSPPNPTSPR